MPTKISSFANISTLVRDFNEYKSQSIGFLNERNRKSERIIFFFEIMVTHFFEKNVVVYECTCVSKLNVKH